MASAEPSGLRFNKQNKKTLPPHTAVCERKRGRDGAFQMKEPNWKNSSVRENVRYALYTIELGNAYGCDGLTPLTGSVTSHTNTH